MARWAAATAILAIGLFCSDSLVMRSDFTKCFFGDGGDDCIVFGVAHD